MTFVDQSVNWSQSVGVTFASPTASPSRKKKNLSLDCSQGVFEWSDQDRRLQIRHTEPFSRTNYSCRLLGTAQDVSGRSVDGNFDRVGAGSAADDFVWSFGFAPENDDFAQATPLADWRGSVVGSTRNASTEIEEPLANGYDFIPLTLWYSWKGDQNGWITFEMVPRAFNSVVAAYSGTSLSALELQGFNDNDGGTTRSRISFHALTDHQYFIDVAGRISRVDPDLLVARGDFTLNWYPTPSPGQWSR